MGTWIKWYLPKDFEREWPNLTRSLYFSLTIFPTKKYNCIAYAAGDKSRWYWPDPYGEYYWPPNAPRRESVDAFVEMFKLRGYEEPEGELRPANECEHVAIYFDRHGCYPYTFAGMPTHAARQTYGKWRSKLGNGWLIEHINLECLNGRFPAYGEPIRLLQRQRRGFWKRFSIFFGNSFIRLF